MTGPRTRREMLGELAAMASALAIPASLSQALGATTLADEDRERLAAWTKTLRAERLNGAKAPLGRAVVRVGEQAVGTPYEAYTLEQYLKAGGKPTSTEPLALSLTRFD